MFSQLHSRFLMGGAATLRTYLRGNRARTPLCLFAVNVVIKFVFFVYMITLLSRVSTAKFFTQRRCGFTVPRPCAVSRKWEKSLCAENARIIGRSVKISKAQLSFQRMDVSVACHNLIQLAFARRNVALI